MFSQGGIGTPGGTQNQILETPILRRMYVTKLPLPDNRVYFQYFIYILRGEQHAQTQ